MGKWAERMAAHLRGAGSKMSVPTSEPLEGAVVGGAPDFALPVARPPSVAEHADVSSEKFLHPPMVQPSKPSEVTSEPFEGAGVVGSGEIEAGARAKESSKHKESQQYAPAREESAAMYARAREAMHRLGYRDDDAEAQLQDVLQTVPAATVAADLQAIGDDRGLPPTVDPAQELHSERLQRWGLPPAVIASLAPRLALRDREGGDLRSCAECARFGRIGASRGQVVWFCRHPSPMVKHGCHGPDVLFRCDGFIGCR